MSHKHMGKHTPGPWKWVTKRNKRGSRICTALIKTGSLECLGAPEIAWLKSDNGLMDMALIAAAPELLEALKACLKVLRIDSDMEEDFQAEIQQAQAAIAKAEGGKP